MPVRARRVPSASMIENSWRRVSRALSTVSSTRASAKLPTRKPASRPARCTGTHRSVTSRPRPPGNGTKYEREKFGDAVRRASLQASSASSASEARGNCAKSVGG